LLHETWERYRLPLAVTEVHIDATREDQLRWLLEIWRACDRLRQAGADVRAVTVWALLGSYDWNTLVTQQNGYYEPGAFDLRAPSPRPTAIARTMRELAETGKATHPALHGNGWWRRPGRFLCTPVGTHETVTSLHKPDMPGIPNRPILIIGATGTLGCAFGRICEQRNLSYRLLSRRELDIAAPESVENAIRQYRPWAIVNAGGFVRVDDAEHEVDQCFRDNTIGPAVLSQACARHGIRLMTFSTDLVFDGGKQAPYHEADAIAPLNNYGRSKAEAEKRVLDRNPDALVVRTSAFFGPWDNHNFVTVALRELSQGRPFCAADDTIVSPTYVPDLVHVCLDLLVDGESGIWHLANAGAVTWADLALAACERAGIDPSRLESRPASHLNLTAPRPAYSAIASRRGLLMPSLEDAIGRHVTATAQAMARSRLNRATAGS
jgi:dTDP-4-dehydrorhamnose reductase